MTTMNIKHEFIVETLQWGLQKLKRVQLEQLILKQHDIESKHFDWQQLFDSVQSRADVLQASGGHYKVVIPVEKRLRYADLKEFKNGAKGPNAKVYNRPTWGVLFGRDDSVYTRLQQGISDQLREQMADRLREALSIDY